MRPFCWIPSNTPTWRINRLQNRIPDATIHYNEKATGRDGRPLIKLEVDKPNDLWEVKDLMPTYEAIILTKSYFTSILMKSLNFILVCGTLTLSGTLKKISLQSWLLSTLMLMFP
jgi:hypothetical protein